MHSLLPPHLLLSSSHPLSLPKPSIPQLTLLPRSLLIPQLQLSLQNFVSYAATFDQLIRHINKLNTVRLKTSCSQQSLNQLIRNLSLWCRWEFAYEYDGELNEYEQALVSTARRIMRSSADLGLIADCLVIIATFSDLSQVNSILYQLADCPENLEIYLSTYRGIDTDSIKLITDEEPYQRLIQAQYDQQKVQMILTWMALSRNKNNMLPLFLRYYIYYRLGPNNLIKQSATVLNMLNEWIQETYESKKVDNTFFLQGMMSYTSYGKQIKCLALTILTSWEKALQEKTTCQFDFIENPNAAISNLISLCELQDQHNQQITKIKQRLFQSLKGDLWLVDNYFMHCYEEFVTNSQETILSMLAYLTRNLSLKSQIRFRWVQGRECKECVLSAAQKCKMILSLFCCLVDMQHEVDKPYQQFIDIFCHRQAPEHAKEIRQLILLLNELQPIKFTYLSEPSFQKVKACFEQEQLDFNQFGDYGSFYQYLIRKRVDRVNLLELQYFIASLPEQNKLLASSLNKASKLEQELGEFNCLQFLRQLQKQLKSLRTAISDLGCKKALNEIYTNGRFLIFKSQRSLVGDQIRSSLFKIIQQELIHMDYLMLKMILPIVYQLQEGREGHLTFILRQKVQDMQLRLNVENLQFLLMNCFEMRVKDLLVRQKRVQCCIEKCLQIKTIPKEKQLLIKKISENSYILKKLQKQCVHSLRPINVIKFIQHLVSTDPQAKTIYDQLYANLQFPLCPSKEPVREKEEEKKAQVLSEESNDWVDVSESDNQAKSCKSIDKKEQQQESEQQSSNQHQYLDNSNDEECGDEDGSCCGSNSCSEQSLTASVVSKAEDYAKILQDIDSLQNLQVKNFYLIRELLHFQPQNQTQWNNLKDLLSQMSAQLRQTLLSMTNSNFLRILNERFGYDAELVRIRNQVKFDFKFNQFPIKQVYESEYNSDSEMQEDGSYSNNECEQEHSERVHHFIYQSKGSFPQENLSDAMAQTLILSLGIIDFDKVSICKISQLISCPLQGPRLLKSLTVIALEILREEESKVAIMNCGPLLWNFEGFKGGHLHFNSQFLKNFLQIFEHVQPSQFKQKINQVECVGSIKRLFREQEFQGNFVALVIKIKNQFIRIQNSQYKDQELFHTHSYTQLPLSALSQVLKDRFANPNTKQLTLQSLESEFGPLQSAKLFPDALTQAGVMLFDQAFSKTNFELLGSFSSSYILSELLKVLSDYEQPFKNYYLSFRRYLIYVFQKQKKNCKELEEDCLKFQKTLHTLNSLYELINSKVQLTTKNLQSKCESLWGIVKQVSNHLVSVLCVFFYRSDKSPSERYLSFLKGVLKNLSLLKDPKLSVNRSLIYVIYNCLKLNYDVSSLLSIQIKQAVLARIIPQSHTKVILVRKCQVEMMLLQLSSNTPKLVYMNEEGIDQGGIYRDLMGGMGSFWQGMPESSLEDQQVQLMVKLFVDAARLNYITNFCPDSAFLKFVRGQEDDVNLQDLSEVDQELARHLQWLLNNQVQDLSLNFTIWSKGRSVELKDMGQQIEVNNQNKQEYVQLTVQWVLLKRRIEFLKEFKKQLQYQMGKFYKLFSVADYKTIFLGEKVINPDKLRKMTALEDIQESQPLVAWFWEVVSSMTQFQLRQLIRFWTGMHNIPSTGLQDFNLTVSKNKVQGDNLPVAHTCMNTLKLAEYVSREQLQEKLLLALNQGAQEFNLS